jgi:hypothetical protein
LRELPALSVTLGPSRPGKTALLQNMIMDLHKDRFGWVLISNPIEVGMT